MNVAFRVDASDEIGTGHLMRCLTLADALKLRGVKSRFVCRHMPAHLRKTLNTKGYEFSLLNTITSEETDGDIFHAHWLKASQAQDATDTTQALSDQIWDWLVVDHYALDARWETALRNLAKNILVIDDIADRQHDCDVLVDPNFYVDMDIRYDGKVPAHCRLLLGPRYALLREEFQYMQKQIKPRNGTVTRVLVFFGGVDAENYTSKAIEALADINNSGLYVDVVVGSQNPHCQQIETACALNNFTLHVQTNQIAELMSTADLAIGAGGSATWERCCLGVPTLAVCLADNQKKQINDAASEGMLYAPDVKGDLLHFFKRHFIALMENRCLRNFISRNGMVAVDGSGVLRIIDNLGYSGIDIRTARHDDSEKLFEWRNCKTVRDSSRCADLIAWESHQKWFASVLASSDRLLLIGQREGLPVGVVRFDIQGDETEVSIYLVPGNAQPGQGRALLQRAERWLVVNRPDVLKIRAIVLGDNERSQRLFTGAGYQVDSTCYLKRLRGK